MKKWYIFLLILSGWEISLIAQAKITVRLSQDSLLIGDILTCYLEIQHDNNVELIAPDFGILSQIDSVELVEEKPWDTIPSNRFMLLKKEVNLTSFDSGNYVLPQLRIYYRQNGVLDSVFSASLPFIVRPVPSDILPLKSIKPIVELPTTWWEQLSPALQIALFIFAIIWGLYLLVFIVLLFILNQKQKFIESPKTTAVSASQYYLVALEELNEQTLWQKGQIKAYHSTLSYILRAYLEKRYAIQALESTTSEILEALNELLTRHQLDELEWLLRMVDLVKFAKTEPSNEFHEEAYQSVKNFIQNTDNQTLLINQAPQPLLSTSKQHYLINDEGEETELALTLARFWAKCIDGLAVLLLLCLGVFLMYYFQKLSLPAENFDPEIAMMNIVLQVGMVLLPLLLLVIFLLEWFTGKTLGKHWLNIKLVHQNNKKLPFGAMLLRFFLLNIANAIFLIILMVSVSINISTGSRILLHDRWTRTRVISLKK